MKKIKTLILIFFFILLSGSSYAFYCSEPSPPNTFLKPTKPTKPFVPSCVNEFMGTHTCDSWTISNYNSEVEMYNSNLQSYKYEVQNYISELQRYVEDAREYANCEISNLN